MEGDLGLRHADGLKEPRSRRAEWGGVVCPVEIVVVGRSFAASGLRGASSTESWWLTVALVALSSKVRFMLGLCVLLDLATSIISLDLGLFMLSCLCLPLGGEDGGPEPIEKSIGGKLSRHMVSQSPPLAGLLV